MLRFLSFRFSVPALLILLFAGLAAWAQPSERQATQQGYLGVLVVSGDEGEKGVVVQEVTPDSPAAKAGLKQGDRIVKMGDEEVGDIDKVLRSIAARKPGEKVKLGILRDGKEQTITVTMGERPAREIQPFPSFPGIRQPAFLGVHTQALTSELKEQLKVEAEAGLVVTEVVPRSPAARAGLKRDDVITAIDDHPMKSPADLREAVQKAGTGKEVSLQVVRGKEKLSVKATLREGPSGLFPNPGEERFPGFNPESLLDQSRRIRELERRIEELEKRIRQLEKK